MPGGYYLYDLFQGLDILSYILVGINSALESSQLIHKYILTGCAGMARVFLRGMMGEGKRRWIPLSYPYMGHTEIFLQLSLLLLGNMSMVDSCG
jgi:hypothetical protein